ncbi:MAG: glycosyltransferase [Clostridia bacterium]|nr:glycosyltransferase [Clostridia bacterium]
MGLEQTNQIKKRVLIVVPSLGIGGQEKVAVDTVLALKDDYEIRTVTFHKKENGKEYPDPCDVVCINVRASKSKIQKVFSQFIRARKLKKIRKEFKPDYVYSFGATANLTNVLSKSYGKCIVAVHHGLGNSIANAKDRFVFKRADVVIAISKAMQAGLKKLYPEIDKFITIENGYDISTIQKLSLAAKEQMFGFPALVAVGRHESVKGYHRLIRAFEKVSTLLPQAELYMVGEGSLTDELKELSYSLGLESKIHFVGYQANPYVYLKSSDMMVLSSYSEGFPNSVIEALACGTCVIATNCGALEILSDDSPMVEGICFAKYGVLVENSEDRVVIDLLAEAIISLATHKEQHQEYMRLAATRAQEYSIETYTRKVISLFNMLSKS